LDGIHANLGESPQKYLRNLMEETRVSSFSFTLSEKELELMNVHFLWRFQECMNSNKAFPACTLFWVNSLFVMCLPRGLSVLLTAQISAAQLDVKSIRAL
jgi:hypothetical protein